MIIEHLPKDTLVTSIGDVATLLGVSKRTIVNRLRNGEMPEGQHIFTNRDQKKYAWTVEQLLQHRRAIAKHRNNKD